MSSYTAVARPWKHGWELHVAEYGVTQVRVLANAAQQVRDYVATVTDTDVGGDVPVVLRYELDGVEKEIRDVQQRLAAAVEAQAAAAADMRRLVGTLRDMGISVRDTGTILERSPGRVSQLLAGAE